MTSSAPAGPAVEDVAGSHPSAASPVPAASHPLAAVLRAAADGRFPAADGGVEVVPRYLPDIEACVSLTGHAVVATARALEELLAAGADGFGGVNLPGVVSLLAGPGGDVGTLDALLVSRGTGQTLLPERRDQEDHPRAVQARRWRSEVSVHGDERGVVVIARGVGGLPELSFEVDPGRRGWGVGRALLADGLGLVPDGEPVLAAVAPGNAASLRAVLSVGFVPIGSVQLIRPAAVSPPR